MINECLYRVRSRNIELYYDLVSGGLPMKTLEPSDPEFFDKLKRELVWVCRKTRLLH